MRIKFNLNLIFAGISIHVHVTPYQVQDDHRPWIRKEEKAFTDLLKRLGCTLTRHLHSSESTCSNLFTHFEVLENFRLHQIHEIQQQIHHQIQQELQPQSQTQNQTDNQESQNNNQQNDTISVTESTDMSTEEDSSQENQIIHKTADDDSSEAKIAENSEV